MSFWDMLGKNKTFLRFLVQQASAVKHCIVTCYQLKRMYPDMKVQTMVAATLLGAVTYMRLCTATCAVHSDLYALFGCLHVYGFVLDLPGRKKFFGDINNFVSEHFSLLCAEKHETPVLNLRVSSLDGDGTLVSNFKRHAALNLNSAAVVVAMKMELRKYECTNMVTHIVKDSNFGDLRLLLMAATNLKMRWLEDEILQKIDISNTNVSFYILLRKYIIDSSHEVTRRITQVINTKVYEEVHMHFRTFCLEARNEDSDNHIVEVQARFEIIRRENFAYFMNEELLFVLELFATSEHLRVCISEDILRDRDIKLLLRRGAWLMLRGISFAAIRRNLFEMTAGEEDRLCMIRAVEAAFFASGCLQGWKDVHDRVDPQMSQFIFHVQIYNSESMRAFLDTNPEYIDEAAITWVVNRFRKDTLDIFLEKMREGGGVEIVFDAATSQRIVRNIKDEDIECLVGTGIVLTLDYAGLAHMTKSANKRAFLRNRAQVHVPAYDMGIIRCISEHGVWHLLDNLREKVKSSGVLDTYKESLSDRKKPVYFYLGDEI